MRHPLLKVFSLTSHIQVLILLFLLSTNALAEQRLKVGVTLPLTGMAAEYGGAYRSGIELALREKATVSDRISFSYEDHKYDTKSAVGSAQKLISIDKVDLLVAWGWAPSDAIAPLSDHLGTPMLLSSINPIGKGRPRVFNLASPLSHLLKPLADYIVQHNFSSIAYVATPVGALEQSVGEIQAVLPSTIATVANISVTPDAMDFKTIIAKLKAAGPEALGLFLLPGQIKIFLEQARAQEFFPKLLGENTFNDSVVVDLLSAYKSPPIFVDWVTESNFDERLDKLQFPRSHRSEVAQGYFLGSLLLKVAERETALSADQILAILHELPPGESPAGRYKIENDESNGWQVIFPSALYSVAGGKVSLASSGD